MTRLALFIFKMNYAVGMKRERYTAENLEASKLLHFQQRLQKKSTPKPEKKKTKKKESRCRCMQTAATKTR